MGDWWGFAVTFIISFLPRWIFWFLKNNYQRIFGINNFKNSLKVDSPCPFGSQGETNLYIEKQQQNMYTPLNSPIIFTAKNIMEPHSTKSEDWYSHPTVGVCRSVTSSCLWPRGLLRARLLCPGDSPGKNTGGGWVAISFSRGSSWPRDRTPVSCIAGRFFTLWATREAHVFFSGLRGL